MMKIRGEIIAAAACLCLAVFPSEGFAEAEAINGSLEDGSYIVRIPEGDLGWFADDMVEDDAVVRLAEAELVDGEFILRYDPVGDGESVVGARHYYNAFACDEVHTWTLQVKDGAIQEVTGGSFISSPDDDFLEPYLTGEWTGEEDPSLQMSVSRGELHSWDVEAVSAAEEDSYVFRASICFDCYQDALVYDKGKFFDVPESEGAEPGEAVLYGTTGSFRFEGEDESSLKLVWSDDEKAGREIVFVKAESASE